MCKRFVTKHVNLGMGIETREPASGLYWIYLYLRWLIRARDRGYIQSRTILIHPHLDNCLLVIESTRVVVTGLMNGLRMLFNELWSRAKYSIFTQQYTLAAASPL